MRIYASVTAVLVAVSLAFAAGLTESPSTAQNRQRSASAPLGWGYLEPAEEPDSLTLIPMPPSPRSPAQARDRAATKQALARSGSPRWILAREDSELRLPQALNAFSCAADIRLDAVRMPRLMALLAKSQADLASSTYPAKTRYMRPRPFAENHRPTCTPERDAYQRNDGSYPSGHAAIGWGWALILAELLPERSDLIFARGRAFGHSRILCNVHWLSDVEEGRMIGAATVAMLHANPSFVADLATARSEIAAIKENFTVDSSDCSAETAALAADNGA